MSRLKDQPILETERLIIRELQPPDWPAMANLMVDPAIRRFMRLSAWDSPESRQAWLEWTLSNQTARIGGNYNWGLILKHGQQLVGWVGIGDSDRMEREGDRSMGYVLSPEYWSQGLMTEGLQRILDYEFQALGVVRVTANCETENVASARVMEKVGMSYVRTVADPDPIDGNVAERHHYALETPLSKMRR